jgi:hypothetical protein
MSREPEDYKEFNLNTLIIAVIEQELFKLAKEFYAFCYKCTDMTHYQNSLPLFLKIIIYNNKSKLSKKFLNFINSIQKNIEKHIHINKEPIYKYSKNSSIEIFSHFFVSTIMDHVILLESMLDAQQTNKLENSPVNLLADSQDPPKRKRGRPPGKQSIENTTQAIVPEILPATDVPKRKGRPTKNNV